jgi:hypothetical protein
MNRYQTRIAYAYQEGSHLTSTHIPDDSTLVRIISTVQLCRSSTTSAQYSLRNPAAPILIIIPESLVVRNLGPWTLSSSARLRCVNNTAVRQKPHDSYCTSLCSGPAWRSAVCYDSAPLILSRV